MSNWSRLKEIEGQMTSKWNMWPWAELFCWKDHYQANKENWMKFEDFMVLMH